jgi:hypothetical protein
VSAKSVEMWTVMLTTALGAMRDQPVLERAHAAGNACAQVLRALFPTKRTQAEAAVGIAAAMCGDAGLTKAEAVALLSSQWSSVQREIAKIRTEQATAIARTALEEAQRLR